MSDPLRELDDEDRSGYRIDVVPLSAAMEMNDSWNQLALTILKEQSIMLRDWWLRHVSAFSSGVLICTIFAKDTLTMSIVWFISMGMTLSCTALLAYRQRRDAKAREG